jgi:hypothetical protein
MKGMIMTRTATLLVSIGAMTLACSSQVFTSASADAGASIGGSDTGGSQSAGGSCGRFGAGGARSSGGLTGSGARPVGGSPGSTGGITSSDSGVITTDGGVVSSDSGVITSDGGVASGVLCTGPDPVFPTFQKGCTTDANCVRVSHTTSCCGSELVMGINHAELARFQAAESICDAQYPGCGCASQGANAEDGTLVPWGSENLIVVSCDNGVCLSHYSGKTFPCGTATCTDLQFCSSFTGGPAGSPTTYSCNFLGGCSSCSCVASTGCVCTQDQGFIKVSCAAP